jgi:Rps23 Pro-64 3,4-dihydroxylase Tpa1-like proline 4-hydroxylase
MAEVLSEAFPTESFVRAQAGAHSIKDYRNYSRPLTTTSIGDLSPQWRALIDDLCSLDYRRAVAQVLGQATIADRVELRLVRHGITDFLGPHTDRCDKIFSHIIYFNPDWDDEWGGHFEILDGDMAVVTRIRPVCGASVLLGRSDHSWHQVACVRDVAASERRSLLVHGRRG